VPGTLNTGTVTFGFKTHTSAENSAAIAIGGKITLLVPRGYFASLDTGAAKFASTSVTGCTATCALTAAVGVSANDMVVCTTIGAVVPVDTAVTVTLPAGVLKTGVATTPVQFKVSTSQDNAATGNAAGLGGFVSAGVAMTFTNKLDQTAGKFSFNNDTIQVGFTTGTAIPIGGAIILTMPPNYFSYVDASKSVKVGSLGTTASCSVTQSSLSNNLPTTISTAVATLSTQTTLTINFIPSLITGFTQLNVPLVGGFVVDAAAVATCSANCIDTGSGKATFTSFTGGVLTLTLPFTNMFKSVNTLTTFTLTLVTTPATAGWATSNILSSLYKPYATVTCVTAAAVLSPAAQTLTFPALSVTIGSAQNAGIVIVETSVDLPLELPVAAPAIAIGTSSVVRLAFSNPADAIPGRTNIGKLTLGFSSANSLAIGALVLLKFPKFYFTRVDPKAANTLTDSAAPSSAFAHVNSVVGTRITSTLSCVLTAAVAPATQDTVTCTIGGSASGTGDQTLTFVPGAITTGLSAGGGFTVATAPPPTAVKRTPYFPKDAASSARVAWLLAALALALACF